MAQRIKAVVTMKNIYSYEAPAYGYGYETKYIYTMVAEDGTVYVWKTTTFMGYEVEDPNGWIIREKKGQEVVYRFDNINKNDVIEITASVKGQGEYKGQPQTELTRVKVVSRIVKAKTKEEIIDEKKQEQKETLKPGDFIWRMPYKQYKDHYSDCETIAGSYDSGERAYRRVAPSIEVIIREGRLKNSGVRGEHFIGYEILFNEDGKQVRTVYRAVSEENAIKRFNKDFPNATDVKMGQIYDYRRM